MPLVALNGQRIFYEDTEGEGPAIVCLHGLLMDQSMFDPQVEALSPAYRMVRFDARAFGQTEWDKKPFSLYDTVDDCLALMDHLEIERAVLFGMSQGGYVSLRLALKHPDRVRAMVLMSTCSGVDSTALIAMLSQVRDTWKAQGPIDQLLESLMPLILGPRETHSGLWDKWWPRWKKTTGEAMFRAMNCVLERDDITSEQLSTISCPTLVTHGEQDQGIVFALGQKLAQDLPNNHGLVAIPVAAHAANLTNPEAVNPAISEFLRQHIS